MNPYVYNFHINFHFSSFSIWYFFPFFFSVTRVVNEWGPQTLGLDPGSMYTNVVKDTIKQGMLMSSGLQICKTLDHSDE